MTVGIAAICQEDKDPHVVLAADRMITTGVKPRIEYEHTESKIQTIHDNEVVNCMGVASGTVTYIEEFFDRLDEKLEGTEPTSVKDIAQRARDAYTELAQDTAENTVLDQLDISLSELSDLDEDRDSDVVASLLSDVADHQNDFANQLEVLLGGVDGLGAHLYSVEQFDLNPQNTIGYHAVGSGTQPAQSVFIRNSYDTSANVKRGILNVIEAKDRSEQARGVGTEMDLAIIQPPIEGEQCCEVFSEDRKREWVNLYERIIEEEQSVREDIISESALDHPQGDQA